MHHCHYLQLSKACLKSRFEDASSIKVGQQPDHVIILVCAASALDLGYCFKLSAQAMAEEAPPDAVGAPDCYTHHLEQSPTRAPLSPVTCDLIAMTLLIVPLSGDQDFIRFFCRLVHI